MLLSGRPSGLTTAVLDTLGDADLLLLTATEDAGLGDLVRRGRTAARRVGLVVTNEAEAHRAAELGADFLVAKGHEAGGLVGDETAFVLLQRLLPRVDLPLYVWGGIGFRTAAACQAAGAAGMVLDWQLALLRESPVPAAFRRRLATMDGSETALMRGPDGGWLHCYAQPGFTAKERLEQAAGTDELEGWNRTLATLLAGPTSESRLWLLGQDGCFAAPWAAEAPTVARVLGLLRERVQAAVAGSLTAEDSFAGILPNITAGRISNRFDLGGANFTVDAACASSLAAVSLACRGLADGSSDVAIAGGCDLVQNAFAYLCFATAGALSPRGRSRTLDESADGIAISEGLAALVLKRRADAERDGDRIYAFIRAAAGASDGRSKGLTAPRPEGQIRTLTRAYAQAGFSPATVGLFEAHGTGTAVGDATECQALTNVLTEQGAAKQSVALGSIKSVIGHTKSSAGVAGLVKAVLALYHRVLPPTLHVERPNAKAGLLDGPLYANTETRPWIAGPQPRRAGVSSLETQQRVMEAYFGGTVPPGKPGVLTPGFRSSPGVNTPGSPGGKPLCNEPKPAPNGHALAKANPVQPAQATASPKPAGRTDLAELLIEVASQRTGYPPEMLSVEANLEADLGIDSIKRCYRSEWASAGGAHGCRSDNHSTSLPRDGRGTAARLRPRPGVAGRHPGVDRRRQRVRPGARPRNRRRRRQGVHPCYRRVGDARSSDARPGAAAARA